MLTQLDILNYRNHHERHLQLGEKVVLINGQNGSGKTNLIDAIHYICLCRSYFQRSDQAILRYGTDFFRLDATFSGPTAKDCVVSAKIRVDKKKEFFLDGVLYERLSEHIGRFPVAMIAPDDIRLIQQYPEERRRFLDTTIAQLDSKYLLSLQAYNRVLSQRNALLKQGRDTRRWDMSLLQVLNQQLAESAFTIHTARQKFVQSLQPHAAVTYSKLSGGKEVPDMVYQSDLNSATLMDLLKQNESRDKEAGKTIMGLHRDDLIFSLDEMPLKQVASQGQIKSWLIALKLAPYMMSVPADRKPVLLLDDIFEKLDRSRLEALFQLLEDSHFGQVFITDADDQRSHAFLTSHGIHFDHLITNT